MNNKKLKTASIIALSLLAGSIVYAFVLLLFGVYGNSLITVGNGEGSSSDMGQNIGLACSISIHIVIVAFALIVKFLNLVLGFSSCFARKRKGSIITAAVFTCIIALISALIGSFVLFSYFPISANNGNSILMCVAFVLMPLTDLLWVSVAIARAVILSKEVKNNAVEVSAKNAVEVNIETEESGE